MSKNDSGRRMWTPVLTRPGKELAVRHDDVTVTAMGADDGAAGLGTNQWGDNKLWGLWAVLTSLVTHAAAIRARLDEVIIHQRAAYEKAKAQFRSAAVAADTAITQAAEAAAGRRAVAQKLADHGLEPPGHRWPTVCFLALIVLGDLSLTSISMATLGVSDAKLVPGLPFSHLDLAAAPVVAGMVGAAHVLGEAIRERRDADQRLRTHIKVIIGVSLGAGCLLALSTAAVRSTFMTANHYAPMTLAFIGLQLGLFGVALGLSAWSAHPYGPEHRRHERLAGQAVRRFHRLHRRAVSCAAKVNSAVARHTGTVASARAGVEAVAADAVRQGHVYLREVVRNQAEPVSEPVFHDELPEIKLPSSARELLDYPDVPSNSTLAPPETVSCEDLERRWAAVQSGPVAPHTERLHVVHDEGTEAGGA